METNFVKREFSEGREREQMSDETTRQFNYQMRQSVPQGFRDLLDSATEVHVKHGLKRGAEGRPEWERLRAALMDLARHGFVAEEWTLEERF
jgi:hypothetical protein